MADEPLTCVRCGKALAAGEAVMAPPLITAGELARMAVKTPAMLAGPPLPDVAYCADCRQIVAKQRPIEQIKVLGALLLVLALIAIVIFVVL